MGANSEQTQAPHTHLRKLETMRLARSLRDGGSGRPEDEHPLRASERPCATEVTDHSTLLHTCVVTIFSPCTRESVTLKCCPISTDNRAIAHTAH